MWENILVWSRRHYTDVREFSCSEGRHNKDIAEVIEVNRLDICETVPLALNIYKI